MENLVNNNAMADILSMTPSAFAKGVREGRFSVSGLDENGHNLFDAGKVLEEYSKTSVVASLQNHAGFMPEGMRGGRPNGSSVTGEYNSDDYLRVKIEKDVINAKILELKLKIQEGKLVEKEDILKSGIELGGVVISTLASWSARMSPVLANMKDKTEHDIKIFLDSEINLLVRQIREKCGFNENG